MPTFYHGSPARVDKFNPGDVFLAKSPAAARRYGGVLHRVTYQGAPRFETPTILVIDAGQIERIEVIEVNPEQVIYRT